MIDPNKSSQDYFLILKNSVIAQIFLVLIHMVRNYFITHADFPFYCSFLFFFLFFFYLHGVCGATPRFSSRIRHHDVLKKNQSRGKYNLFI